MGRVVVLAMLVCVAQTAISGQTLVVLHIRAALIDATGRATPLARHALLISDNPPTREPRRILTSLDGTADVRLRPGNYIVESDQPVAFQGKEYHWTQTLAVVAGRDSALELTAENAVAEPIAPGTTNAASALATDPSLLLRQWLDSVVELWTPTAHASGFLVDASGLIATNQTVADSPLPLPPLRTARIGRRWLQSAQSSGVVGADRSSTGQLVLPRSAFARDAVLASSSSLAGFTVRVCGTGRTRESLHRQRTARQCRRQN